MRLQLATRYAVLAVLELASRPGEQVSSGEIAGIYGMSQHHLAKVLRTLSRNKIVASVRGPAGGCMFIGKANRLTLYDIIDLFEDNVLATSDSRTPETPIGGEMERVLREIDRITLATLRSVTIQTVINSARRRQQSVAAPAS